MVDVHITVGILLLSLNLIAGVWGIAAWLLRKPTVIFWYLLRAAQITVVIQAVLGAILLLDGHNAKEDIHYLYGILPLGIAFLTEMMRVGAAQKVVGDVDYAELPEDEARALALQIFIAETRVMALGCLIIAALAARAAMTSGI